MQRIKWLFALLLITTVALAVPTELKEREIKLVPRTALDHDTLNARELVYRKYLDPTTGKETFELACGSYTVCFYRVCITYNTCKGKNGGDAF